MENITFDVKEHTIGVKTSKIEATFVDNAAFGDTHKAGYSGLASLKGSDQERSIFVPDYAGLNYELIYDGEVGLNQTAMERDLVFQPRRVPIRITKEGNSVILTQENTPYWRLAGKIRFDFIAEDTIDINMDFTPTENTFHSNWFGVFFASYIHKPWDPNFYFVGRKKQSKKLSWVSGGTKKHGTKAIHGYEKGIPIKETWPFNKDYTKAFMISHKSISDLKYTAPIYYGIFDRYAYIIMFDQPERLMFTHSPSGGGRGCPAWDWQYRWENIQLNHTYSAKARFIYRPFTCKEDVLLTYLEWQHADKKCIENVNHFLKK
jgi:hypothetical protein